LPAPCTLTLHASDWCQQRVQKHVCSMCEIQQICASQGDLVLVKIQQWSPRLMHPDLLCSICRILPELDFFVWVVHACLSH